MSKLKVLDLFSGIGGFSLGLERTGGFETVAFCEIEPFPRKVLAKHWPGVPQYDDVRTLTGDILARDGIAVDVITGGFPCQDLSVAGNQRGMGEGTRSGLWSEIVRLIGELSPSYVIVENVANLLSGPSEQRGGWFGRVLGDLAECGYDAEWENIPASALGAPHRRERVWIVAYRNGGDGQPGAGKRPELWGAAFGERADNDACGAGVEPKALAHTNKAGLQGRKKAGDISGGGAWSHQLFERCADMPGGIWEPEPYVGGGLDGFSAWLDGLDLTEAHKLVLAYGNESKDRPEEIMRTLRDAACSFDDWQQAGRSRSFSAAAVLFSYMRQLEENYLDQARIQLEGAEAPESFVRVLRSPEKPSGAPCGSGYISQRIVKHTNALQALSRLLAYHAEKAWIEYRRSDASHNLGWESGIARVANGVPDRSHRLAALGNAVVPQIPELIGRSILAAEKETL